MSKKSLDPLPGYLVFENLIQNNGVFISGGGDPLAVVVSFPTFSLRYCRGVFGKGVRLIVSVAGPGERYGCDEWHSVDDHMFDDRRVYDFWESVFHEYVRQLGARGDKLRTLALNFWK